MDDKLIECMARAAYESWIDAVQCCEPPWRLLPEDHRLRLKEAMRAALWAQRMHVNLKKRWFIKRLYNAWWAFGNLPSGKKLLFRERVRATWRIAR